MKKRTDEERRVTLTAPEEELYGLLKPLVPRKTVREFEEILVIEFISVTGGVLAGALLAQFLDKIALIPGILILLPGFLAMRGNISGSLAARLSVGLHQGLLKHREQHYIIRSNALSGFVLGVLASLFLGIVAYAATWYFFQTDAPGIIAIALIASIISNLIMIPLTSRTAVWLWKRGIHPENVMGPYITTIGDIVSVVSLILAVILV